MPYTDKNIFNVLHNQQSDLVIDKDARIYTVTLRLTPADIVRLKLKNIIFIQGQRFLINKIENYEATDRRLTKVELIKLSTGIPTKAEIPIQNITIEDLLGLTTDDGTLWLTGGGLILTE